METTGIRLFDGLHDGLERALDLRRNQHVLISGNLANAETPGFRAREIPFAEVLGAEIRAAERGQAHDDGELVRELDPLPWALDGNSVNPEREAVKLMENSLLYNALTSATSKRMSLLRFAASDGRS
jgi:flagellar basal-body rod protein FlgB